MTHYEERLERDLEHIKEKVGDLSERVEGMLKDSSLALFTNNERLAYSVILGDHPVNRASRELDKICHRFFAVHLPSAGHLRFVSSVMRVNLELERIGDYAVTICRESVQIGHPPKGTIGSHLGRISEEAQGILRRAIAAFKDGDTDQAGSDMDDARKATRGFDDVFRVLVKEEGNLRVEELFYYLVVFNMFGRVFDQAKNICEETIFSVTGQTKAPKTYRILFLDEDNSILGPMAQAVARKNFPEWGEYTTAGRIASTAISGEAIRFLEELGIESITTSPRALDAAGDLSNYHAIVSLQGPVKSYVDKVPFETLALEWQIGDLPRDSDEGNAQLEALYRSLALQIQDLMLTMHGEEE